MSDTLQEIDGMIKVADNFLDTSQKASGMLAAIGQYLGTQGLRSLPSQKRIIRMINWKQFTNANMALDEVHKQKALLRATWAELKQSMFQQEQRLLLESVQAKVRGEDVSLEDVKEHLDFVARALDKKFKDSMEEFDAQEAVAAYAMLEAAEAQSKGDAGEGHWPSETWSARFFKYAADLRDEELFALWGKVLAGEFRKPGSFSLKTLVILHSLDKPDAEAFCKLAPYVMEEEFIIDEALEDCGVSSYRLAILDSIGLVIKDMKRTVAFAETENQHYALGSEYGQGHALELSFNCSLLTPSGKELYRLVSITEEESYNSALLFAGAAKRKVLTPSFKPSITKKHVQKEKRP